MRLLQNTGSIISETTSTVTAFDISYVFIFNIASTSDKTLLEMTCPKYLQEVARFNRLPPNVLS